MPRKARARVDYRRVREQRRKRRREKRKKELELQTAQLEASLEHEKELEAGLEHEKELEAEPLASPPEKKAVERVRPLKRYTAHHTTVDATMTSPKSYANTPQVASTEWENHMAMAFIPNPLYGLLGVYRYFTQDPRIDGSADTRISNVTTVASPTAKSVTNSNLSSFTTPAEPKATLLVKELLAKKQAAEGLLSLQELARSSIPAQNLTTSMGTPCTSTSQKGSQRRSREISPQKESYTSSTLTNRNRSCFTKRRRACIYGSKRKKAEIVNTNKRDEFDVEKTEAKNKESVEEKNAKDCKKLSNLEEDTSSLSEMEIETGEDEEAPLPGTVNDRGNGLVEDVRTLPVEKLRTIFVEKCQKLRDLRKGVCELLDVLVPEISVPQPEMMPLDDDTVDVLLRDALGTKRGSTMERDGQ